MLHSQAIVVQVVAGKQIRPTAGRGTAIGRQGRSFNCAGLRPRVWPGNLCQAITTVHTCSSHTCSSHSANVEWGSGVLTTLAQAGSCSVRSRCCARHCGSESGSCCSSGLSPPVLPMPLPSPPPSPSPACWCESPPLLLLPPLLPEPPLLLLLTCSSCGARSRSWSRTAPDCRRTRAA